jgi:phosphoribosylformylglycinamidine synthase
VKVGRVPAVDVKKNAKVYDALSQAISKGLVASAIGVGRGGLAVALAKSAIAGQLGIRVDLTDIPGSAQHEESILFSESQGRMLVSVRKGKERQFEKLVRGVPCVHVGEISQNSLSVDIGGKSLELSLPELTSAYRSFFRNW